MSRRCCGPCAAEMEWLVPAYPWIKALHIASVIAWMAGLFYLPRLFVYHAERARAGSELSETLKVMEAKLLRVIMTPAMAASWLFGLMLLATPGVVDWGQGWPWGKAAAVLAMTALHMRLAALRRDFAADANVRTGKYYRILNEVPTVLMLAIVFLVVVKPF